MEKVIISTFQDFELKITKFNHTLKYYIYFHYVAIKMQICFDVIKLATYLNYLYRYGMVFLRKKDVKTWIRAFSHAFHFNELIVAADQMEVAYSIKEKKEIR